MKCVRAISCLPSQVSVPSSLRCCCSLKRRHLTCRARCLAMTKKTIVARRSTIEVFNSHLALRQEHAVEADIRQNYAADVVLLTCTRIYRGHDGVRQSAQILKESFRSGQFKYRTRLVDGEVAFLEWSGQSPVGDIKDGADSFYCPRRQNHCSNDLLHGR